MTYTSVNFQTLYELAEKLFELRKAYICYCDKVETMKQRGGKGCHKAHEDLTNQIREPNKEVSNRTANSIKGALVLYEMSVTRRQIQQTAAI